MSVARVIDGRKPGWFWADNAMMRRVLAEAGPYGCALYTAIAMRAGSDRTAWPSYEVLAADAGMSVRRAKDAVAQLASLGVIVVTERRTADGRQISSLYRLVDEAVDNPDRVQEMHPDRVHEKPEQSARKGGPECTPCTHIDEQEPRTRTKNKNAPPLRGETTTPAPTRPPIPASTRRPTPPASSRRGQIGPKTLTPLETAVLEVCGLDAQIASGRDLATAEAAAGALGRHGVTPAEVVRAARAWPAKFPGRAPEDVAAPDPGQLARWVLQRQAGAKAAREAGTRGPRAEAGGYDRRTGRGHNLVPFTER